MENLNINPNEPYIIEIYEDDLGKYDPAFKVPGYHSREIVQEYVKRMTVDTDFKVFRVWPDGSSTDVTNQFEP